jgi:hypothetical protein
MTTAQEAQRLRDPKTCWRCGSSVEPSADPVTYAGWYGPHLYGEVSRGPRLLTCVCLDCRPAYEQECAADHAGYDTKRIERHRSKMERQEMEQLRYGK